MARFAWGEAVYLLVPRSPPVHELAPPEHAAYHHRPLCPDHATGLGPATGGDRHVDEGLQRL